MVGVLFSGRLYAGSMSLFFKAWILVFETPTLTSDYRFWWQETLSLCRILGKLGLENLSVIL